MATNVIANPRRYQPLPSSGQGASTLSSRQTAMNALARFCTQQHYPQFEAWTQDWVCGRVLENGAPENPNDPPIAEKLAEVCNFLLDKNAENGTAYWKPDVQTSYLSSMKTEIFGKFKALTYFTKEPEWYTDLYTNLKMRGRFFAIKRGEPISNSAVGCSQELLEDMAKALMKTDTPLAHEDRCVITCQFHAVGRSGELSASTWNSTQWDRDDEMFLFDWREWKRHKEYPMTMHPSARGWYMDFFHAKACYLIGGNGRYNSEASKVEGPKKFSHERLARFDWVV